MTDRELLELAAMAAGLRLTWGEKYKVGDDEVDCTDLPYALGDSPDEAPAYWNPLADDGDALRLAVNLKLSVWFEEREAHAWTHIIWVSPVFEPYTGDVNAATRRAIVRAAASIGKGMK